MQENIQQEILRLDWLSTFLTVEEMRAEESGNSFYLVSLLPFALQLPTLLLRGRKREEEREGEREGGGAIKSGQSREVILHREE